MNTRRWIGVMVALGVILGACNYSDGPCYRRGEGEVGGVGGGVIDPSGAGGYYGDSPPPTGGLPSEMCNAPEEKEAPKPPDEGGQEEGLKVFCFKKDWGYPCADRCAAKGLACGAIAYHPKGGQGPGQLWACNDVPIGVMCSYHYPDGSDCFFWLTFSGVPHFPFCAYSGDGQN